MADVAQKMENKDENPRIFLRWFIVYIVSDKKKNEEEYVYESQWI
ncbi:hypothetical protein [Bacillus salacetis]|nr:hypothetical protein [Bacillus salacetis]